MAKTAKGSFDVPSPHFCLVCEQVVIATEKDFMASGHTNDTEHAFKKYALTKHMAAKVIARLRSGVFGSQYRTLEIKDRGDVSDGSTV